MEADGLFDLEGMHAQGAEQSLLEIRDALEYYCLKFLRPWLEEYFYQKVGRDFVFSIRSLFVSFALIFVFAGWLFFFIIGDGRGYARQITLRTRQIMI